MEKFINLVTEVEITEDIDFVTINNISVNFTNGAAIRIDDNQAGGIRFKAELMVTCVLKVKKKILLMLFRQVFFLQHRIS